MQKETPTPKDKRTEDKRFSKGPQCRSIGRGQDVQEIGHVWIHHDVPSALMGLAHQFRKDAGSDDQVKARIVGRYSLLEIFRRR